MGVCVIHVKWEIAVNIETLLKGIAHDYIEMTDSACVYAIRHNSILVL